MKLFKSLLIAPATLGLLAPISAFSSEVDFDAISNYSNVEYQINTNSFNHYPSDNTLLSGGEGLVELDSPTSFSSTTSASFSAEAILGGMSSEIEVFEGDEAVSFQYQYQIGLTSSFTGEDSLDVTIDVGGGGEESGVAAATALAGFDTTEDAMIVDGITYTFPVGGFTVLVGDSTDISAVYTGACGYGGFADYMGNCGTGNSVGVGGAGATVAASYAFDGGLSLAGGVSSPNIEILGEDNDTIGLEAAYSADAYGIAVAYADLETASFIGVNGYYDFDFATISAGYETQDSDAASEDDATAFFLGMTKEVGPGTAELGYGSTDMANVLDESGETGYLYELSYVYPVNDYLTITPGVAIIDVDAGETTIAAVKASFSF